MAIFGVKTRLLWQAGYQSRNPPGNCFLSHITSHYMAKHVSGPFLSSQCTLMTLEWSKIWIFLGQNTHGRVVQSYDIFKNSYFEAIIYPSNLAGSMVWVGGLGGWEPSVITTFRCSQALSRSLLFAPFLPRFLPI